MTPELLFEYILAIGGGVLVVGVAGVFVAASLGLFDKE